MKTALIIIASVIGGLIVLNIILRLVFATVRNRLRHKIAETFSPESIITSSLRANFFGLQSRGQKQIRGNAALVLTADTLWTCLGMPQREVKIPLIAVRNVTLAKSHCGKSVFVDLLRVEFDTSDGPEIAGWYVSDAEAWRQAILKQRLTAS
jgi:hypothetical protein